MKFVVEGLTIRRDVIQRNFDAFAWQLGTGIVLAELPKRGADRGKVYDELKKAAFQAAEVYRRTGGMPIIGIVAGSEHISQFCNEDDVREMFGKVYEQVGDAPERCVDFVQNHVYPAIGKVV